MLNWLEKRMLGIELLVTSFFIILGSPVNSLHTTISAHGQTLDSLNPLQQESTENMASFLNETGTNCNCVIFRFDDIQDYWLEYAQLTPMDIFMSRNQSISLGLIMNEMGDDETIIDKLSLGYDQGLFELALHGWDHVDYTKLNGEEQRVSLLNANEKMQKLFGNKSDVFIPPFNEFNNETLKAMTELDVKILSSQLERESEFDQGKSIFVAKRNVENNMTYGGIQHLPQTIGFKLHENNQTTKVPIDKILNQVNKSISEYGYGVIVLHPTDFVRNDQNRTLDPNEMRDLSLLIDTFLSDNRHIATFSDVAKFRPDFTS